MATIEILSEGRIDERESAFPTAVQLSDGRIICAYSVGGGQYATGGTEFSVSDDGGETWSRGGTVLPYDSERGYSNSMRISLGPDGRTLFAYGSQKKSDGDKKFGEKLYVPVVCRSDDLGETWSPPVVLDNPHGVGVEISNPIFSNAKGTLFAPAALLPPKRLGEKVILFVSDDDGASWPREVTAFADPEGKLGYFEQKFATIENDWLMGVCWTVTLGNVEDRENSFVISKDGGETWSRPRFTGVMGQTMTPVHLGGDRLLVLYNRRYGEQGIVMLLVTHADDAWTIHHEATLYDPRTSKDRPESVADGVDEFVDFAFGYPMPIRLDDGTFLATYWNVAENGKCGISWAKLRVNW